MDDRTLASRLLKLLLPVISAAAVALQLPPERLPEGVNWMFASDLVAALSSRGLHHAMLDWVAETDNASLFSLLKAAAKLMADCGIRAGAGAGVGSDQLVCPRDILPIGLVNLHHFLARLLGNLCVLLANMEMRGQPRAHHPSLLRQTALQLLPALHRLPGAMLLAVSSEQHSQACAASAAELEETWGRMGATCDHWRGVVDLLADHLKQLMRSFDRRSPPADAAAQLVDLCAAIGAVMRALPPLAEVKQLLQRHAMEVPPRLHGAAGSLANSLLELMRLVDGVCVQWTHNQDTFLPPDSVLEALQAGLWQLHTAGCRLAHWAAAGGLQPWKQERAECLTTLCCRIGALVALQKRVWAAGLQCSTAAGFAAAYTRCAPLLRTGCCVGWMDAAVLALRCIVLHWPSTDCTIQRGAALH
jgi:hypothetical protein